MKTKLTAVITTALITSLLLFSFTGCASVSDSPSDSGASPSQSITGTSPSGDSPSDNPSAPAKGTPEKTNFTVGTLNSTAHLLAFVADGENFFKEEGLTVTVSPFASSGELVAGLEAGSLDVAFIGSVPTVTNQAAGHDITIFGGAMTNGHGYVIKTDLVPAGFAQGDITVLKGKNVASVKNSIQDFELLVLLRDNGLEIGEGEDKVNVVYFGSQADAYNALAGAEIDAASVYSPYASVAVAAGHTVVYYCNEVEAFHDQPCCRQVALTSALAQYPNSYIAFERALIKAYKLVQQDRQKTIDHVEKYIKIEKSQIEYEVYGGHAQSVPDPDKKATVTLKNGVVEFGYTDGKDYDIEPLYNTELYKTALEQLIAEYPDESVYKDLKTHFDTAN
ncbi:MAG: ABC transporter substrate-binding protein [Oscillospiraceae bacterium]|jgi:NitT/TauT family transport system substrate-binding protein|nr:ABC transporter substrate-binding protein [Oscillospiraceae bacterium]